MLVLDNLDPQIHGDTPRWPAYMPAGTENHVGDVRDRALVRSLLAGVDAVIHLAAAVGVGQSMYKIEHYCSVSVMGTAILLEEMIPLRERIKKLIVASSMSIYGEGAYRDADGNIACPASRSIAQLKTGRWEPADASGRPLTPSPLRKPSRSSPTRSMPSTSGTRRKCAWHSAGPMESPPWPCACSTSTAPARR